MKYYHKMAYCSYAQYLELCSRLLRNSLKDEFRSTAIKRGEVGLKKAKWVNGKQEEYSTYLV